MGDYLEYEFEETQTFRFEDEEGRYRTRRALNDVGDATDLDWEEQPDLDSELEPDESDRDIPDN